MDRTACADLPFFPLQLLLRQHPDWREHPVAVVDRDAPQGVVQWINDRARAARVLSGMRYAAALSLAPGLRAAEVPERDVRAAVERLTARLRRFTPHVEPAEGEPGVFWLDARGLERLYPSLKQWGEGVRSALAGMGFRSTLVVGFSRFGSYALARAKRGLVVLGSARDERVAARRVPLSRLALDPPARDMLARLGVSDLGQFLDLPVGGVGKRFGPEILKLHRRAAGELATPMQPKRPEAPAMARTILDHPETSVDRLLVHLETMLSAVVAAVEKRGRAVAELHVGFGFERLGDHLEKIRPAAPTRDAGRLLELVRLRLQAVRHLPDGVEEIRLFAGETEAVSRQRDLLEERRRDLEAANRALARVRAKLGDARVVHARSRDGHLPEGRYTWEPLVALAEPKPHGAFDGRMVRRVYGRPMPLPARPRHEPDGWMLRGLEQGPVVRVFGPYVVSGGWWHRTVHREYHFAETRTGEMLWVYYDRPRRRWFLQGRVE